MNDSSPDRDPQEVDIPLVTAQRNQNIFSKIRRSRADGNWNKNCLPTKLISFAKKLANDTFEVLGTTSITIQDLDKMSAWIRGI